MKGSMTVNISTALGYTPKCTFQTINRKKCCCIAHY